MLHILILIFSNYHASPIAEIEIAHAVRYMSKQLSPAVAEVSRATWSEALRKLCKSPRLGHVKL